MASRFADLAFTPAVQAEQERHGSRAAYARLERTAGAKRDRLGPNETEFIRERDSFYLASVSETGWPYVQHRGGPPGFVQVLDPTLIGFLDYPGNGQYVTLGNLTTNDRVALIFMDYPAKRRLKVLGHARQVDARREPELLTRLRDTHNLAEPVEGGLVIRIAAADWNCPQYITPRYTAAEVEAATGLLRSRLEAAKAPRNTKAPPSESR